jgi:isoleucyl-tRNA synthetase
MFRPIDSKPNFPALEEQTLKFWQDQRIFQKSVDQRQDAPLYLLYEGPPTVNAAPGIHHVLSRVFKDVFPRYKAMKGYQTPRIAGWDTHGLPVELGIEQKLGFSSKTEIESYGIGKFNQKCRESVSKNIGEWNKLTERIGFWVDLEHPYITYNNSYIESCWGLIKQLWDRDFVYQGYRVTPHCPRCGTSLSSHEVALGYKDDTPDPSIFIRFRITSQLSFDPDSDLPTFLLAWTTTPWTLTANVALAVNPEEIYVLVKAVSPDGDAEQLIFAKALLEQVLGTDSWEILAEFSGEDLAGVEYERLFEPKPEFVVGGGELHAFNRVVLADFVSMEDGTGIVHTAPAYGQEDYDLGQAEGLPIIHTVDLAGNMMLSGKPWEGKFVKDADLFILDDLKSRGLLHHQGIIKHTYPFCWRCSTPLLYYAKPSWYIKTTAKKEALIEGNEQLNWYPEHIKHGRFGDWLQNNVDWAFSRERYWGTPLPVWRCEACGELDCIGGFEELKGKPGVIGITDDPDFHRPYMDDITFTCKCGETMHRVPEVIDCWFDSGAMPFAQSHYPFENSTLLSDGRFPADYICEAVDQTRGWFYSLHALSMILFDQPCFKNVICLGHILDAEGEKMSKSKGNVVEPWQVINQYGADALRWYLVTSSPPGNVRRFSTDSILEVVRRFLLTLWNTYSFFVTYANIDKYDPREAEGVENRPELDRWILSELNQLIDSVTKALDNYDVTGAGRKIEGFVDDLSNWYIRRSRRRFWRSENDADKLSAYATLYECLTTLSKLLAPITPFVAEEIYQNLVCSSYPGAPQSVHLADFPVSDPTSIDERLSNDTKTVIKVTGLGRSARSKAQIKVRQPLAKVVVKVRDNSEIDGLKELQHQVLDELNVKTMIATTDAGQLVDYEIKPNLTLLGPKYGKDLGKIKSALNELDAQEVAASVGVGNDLQVGEFSLLPDEVLVSTIPKTNYAVAEEGGYVVGVSTEISPELLEEGLVREIIHRLQNMRRSAGYDIADYIETYYQGDGATSQVMAKFADYIKQETLARELVEGKPPDGAYVEEHKVDGNTLTFAVKR